MDAYALQSQLRAAAAIKEGKFKDEIIPVTVKGRKGDVVVDTDEYPRETSLEKLAALKPGDTMTVTGPCGNGFDAAALASLGRIAVVGGGIGTAPLLLLCKSLCAAGCKPDLFVGFRDQPYNLEAFQPYCGKIQLSTDTGAVGHHGLVTDLLRPQEYAVVLACGPGVMMRGVYRLCAEQGTPCLVSMENKMACGLGACLGCTCHTKVGPKTVCKDGPVFKAEEVFDL